jgi:hypothetical protein
VPEPADERRHPPGGDEFWNESWYFDFAAADGSLGGYVRVGLYPNLGVSWYWAYVVRDGDPLLIVRNHDAPLPAGDHLELRDEGLWSQLVCETPHEHWSVGLEAFAVAVDDHREALGAERGDRVALGFDLEWEAQSPPFDYPGAHRYEQPCRVHGDVLIGSEKIAFDGTGERDHSWGTRDWWRFGWCWTSGHLDDGTAFHAFRPLVDGARFTPGFVLPPGGELTAISGFDVETVYDGDGLPARALMRVADLAMDVTVTGHAPVPLVAPDGRSGRLARALCRFAAADGRTGWGWTEWNQPDHAPPPGT